MPDFAYDIPSQELAVWFSVLIIGAVIFGLLVIKPVLRIFLGTGPGFNEAVAFGGSGFNLFYGLLLGLLTVSAYQNSEKVEQAILSEASALGNLYANMESYPEPVRSDVKAMLRDYVLFTVYRDWDAHRLGEYLDGGRHRVDAVRQRLAEFEPRTDGEAILHQAVVSGFREFSDARQARLAGVITQIPDVLWYAVLVGAAINLMLFVLLKMRLRQQLLLGVITSFFLGLILYVIVELDDPLRGEAGLDPDAMWLLWERQMVWDEGTL